MLGLSMSVPTSPPFHAVSPPEVNQDGQYASNSDEHRCKAVEEFGSIGRPYLRVVIFVGPVLT